MWYLITFFLSSIFFMVNTIALNSLSSLMVPNLILIYLVYLVINEPEHKVFITAFIMGMFADHLSVSPDGFYILLMILTSVGLIYLKKFIQISGGLYLNLIFVFISTLVFFIAEMIISLGQVALNLFPTLVLISIINGILLLIMSPILNKIYYRTKSERELKRYE
jgi:rod shape-determining protein MreD